MIIPFAKPLDLASILESGQAFRWRKDSGWFVGVIFNNIVKIRQTVEGMEFACGSDDESVIEPLVRDYLRLHDDLDAIYDVLSFDKRIAAGASLYPGMRILRQEPWECLVSFICSANSNIPRISKNVEDMASSFGKPLQLGNHIRSTFPTPLELAEAGEQKLRELGLGFRAKYVAAVAKIAANGGLDLFALREAAYDEALDALVALPGVGDKVANCVLLFCLDKLEAFPVDVWIDRALREWYADDIGNAKITRKAMRPWAQRYFGRYAGYANQYLFHQRRLEGKK